MEVDPIVGTWVADVAETENGTPPFQSMITFNEGGTITEVSNELGLGLQGPAHGSWAETDDGYVATMQTSVFNADPGAVEGRVQIRMTIEMDGPDHMAAMTAVDFEQRTLDAVEGLAPVGLGGERPAGLTVAVDDAPAGL